MKNNLALFVGALLLVAVVAIAADLTYNTLPQTTDSELVLQHKDIAKAASTTFTNVATADTTLVKSGSGILERIIINKAGGEDADFVVFDNTEDDGDEIASGTAAAQKVLEFGCRFENGLTIVTTSDTPADITVIYR